MGIYGGSVRIYPRLRTCVILNDKIEIPCQRVYDGYPEARKHLPWVAPKAEPSEPATEATN